MYEGKNVFGLTGGIGSGKSTVSEEFARRGAVVADADAIVRELQAPGMPMLEDMQALLGADILDEDGALNRTLAAERAFRDDKILTALNEIVSPEVFRVIHGKIAESAPNELVVLDVPLLIENGTEHLGLKGIIVVATPIETAVKRIVANRNTTEEGARRRIAKQVSYEERLLHADFVIDNGGTEEELRPQINKAWRWMHTVCELGAAAMRPVTDLSDKRK